MSNDATEEQADRDVDAALAEHDRAGGALLSAQDRARTADVALGRALGRRDLIRELVPLTESFDEVVDGELGPDLTWTYAEQLADAIAERDRELGRVGAPLDRGAPLDPTAELRELAALACELLDELIADRPMLSTASLNPHTWTNRNARRRVLQRKQLSAPR